MSSSPTARSAAAARKQRTNSDIPFGVRAIQTGVEVDGIWISRPTTPSRSSSKSKMGLVAAAAAGSSGRNQLASQQQTALDTHSNLSTPLPQISEDDATFTTRLLATSPTTARPTPAGGALSEEALRRLEGAYSPTYRGAPITATATSPTTAAPQLNTYIPSSRMSSPSSSINRHHIPGAASRLPNYQLPPPPPSQQQQQQKQRTSTASADSLTSMSGGATGGGGGLSSRSNRSTSSHSSTSSASRHLTTATSAADKLYHPATHDTIGPLPTNPVRLTAAGYFHNHTSSTSTASSSAAAAYTPTSAAFPGDALANRATRKVNPAFEVLPAGTFGRSPTPYTDDDDIETVLDDRRRAARDSSSSPASASAAGGTRNKLRRASQSTPQWV